MLMNSKVSLRDNYYSSSDDNEEEFWIQPSIIQLDFEFHNSRLIDNIYVQTIPMVNEVIVDPELSREIAEWEAASSFDFSNFENSLDNS